LSLFIIVSHYAFYKNDIAKIIDYKIYDLLTNIVNISKNKTENSNVVVVDIDEKSLSALGQWPWPRIVLAKLMYKINSAHPSAIGMDIMFPEKDRTSPNEINLFYKNNFNISSSITGVPKNFLDNDLIFSSSLKNTNTVMGIYLSNDSVLDKKCHKINSLNIDTKSFDLDSFKYLLCNTPSLTSSIKYNGFVNTYLDEDSILRRMPLFRKYNDKIVPTLSLAILLSISDDIEILENRKLQILNHKISTDEKSNILLQFYNNRWYKKVSLIDILNNKIPKEMITGKIVLLGSSAVSLHDQIVVTGGKKIIGVKVHVTMIDNILNEEYLVQPKIYKLLNAILSLFLSFILFFFLYKKYKKSVFILFITSVSILWMLTIVSFENGTYISISYFLVPFLINFFLVIMLFILIDTYDRYLFKEELNKKHILDLEDKVAFRTQELVKSHKHIEDNINYAALIQNAILPQDNILSKYTSDFFIFWEPRDIVGGDIYFAIELSSKEEVLIMVIDGAGHGVSGAFVTMLVKAISTQIIADIESSKMKPSPALILEYFNKSIKSMLGQEKLSTSNAGFDGGIIYYNQKTNVCKYSGAKTPLYIINDKDIEIIKSDRKNVGYKRTKIDQTYTEYDINIQDDTKLYIATDGIYDQEGSNEKRYSKNRFQKIIQDMSNKDFVEQKNDIIKDFKKFKNKFEQSDDVTVIGFNFNNKSTDE